MSSGLKRIYRCVQQSARSFSTSAPSSSRKKTRKTDGLQADRKRLLISLYHNAENFITLENLSSHIDREFARSPSTSTPRMEYREADLKRELKQRDEMPALITTNVARQNALMETSFRDGGADLEDSNRNARMAAALYGVDESMKVGLESVEGYARRIKAIESMQAKDQSREGTLQE